MEAKDIPMKVAVDSILLQIEKYKGRASSLAMMAGQLVTVNKALVEEPKNSQLVTEKEDLEKKNKELKSLQIAFEKFLDILKEEISKVSLTA